jgi:hypothetical protein
MTTRRSAYAAENPPDDAVIVRLAGGKLCAIAILLKILAAVLDA